MILSKDNKATDKVKVEEAKTKPALGRPKGSKNVGKLQPSHPKNRNLEKVIPDDDLRKKVVSELVRNTLPMFRQKPCKSDEEAEERIYVYFTHCGKKGMLPTIEGLSLALGVTRGTMNDWELGRYNASRGVLVRRAKEFIAEMDAQLVAQNKLPQGAYVFRAKNYYGMVDKTEVQVNTSLAETINEDELKQEIRATVLDDEYIDAEFEEIDK